jgi:PTH1 family peptidyl-tRNA hydrolase
MHLVVGLGNPGPQYQGNRHNLGFMVVDDLLGRARGPAPKEKFGAEIAEVTLGGKRVLLCKPMQFMNVSGQAVSIVAGYWKVPVADVVVVHDELDVPFGKLKLAAAGGPGGHNGIRSIIHSLGTPEFARVRVGIGRPAPGRDAADYVLQDFSRQESKQLVDVRILAADAVESIVTHGVAVAMNKFNGKALTQSS